MMILLFSIFAHFSLCQVPVFHVHCDKSYNCFFDIGEHFKVQISSFLNVYKPLNDSLLPFYHNHREIYDHYEKTVHSQFPSIHDEIRGISDGAGIDFHVIMLLNLQTEIFSYARVQSPHSESCTDILLSKPGVHIRGHNEDGDMVAKQFMYFIDVKIDGSKERFMFYTYPGGLPGCAYGWNHHGLVFSENYVAPKEIQVSEGSIPTHVLIRYLLTSTSSDDAVEKMYKIRNHAAFGFNMNIFDLNKMEEMEIEIAPRLLGVRSVVGNYSHMNNYKILNVEFENEESSVHRQRRVDQFEIWKSTMDVRTILGDTEDKGYPIYRDNDRGMSTLTTVVYDFDKKTADVYLKNPKLYDKDQSFDLTFGNL